MSVLKRTALYLVFHAIKSIVRFLAGANGLCQFLPDGLVERNQMLSVL